MQLSLNIHKSDIENCKKKKKKEKKEKKSITMIILFVFCLSI